MTDPVGLREVVPNQTVPEKCKEFTINTGGAQSTLQDIKLPECAGGFVYEDQSRIQTRNRFIIWRTCHDALELVETSLDWQLSGNRVRYRFQDTPLLSGITIHETFHNVVVLVATVSSVHKLVFPHPNRMHKQDLDVFEGSDEGIPSVFSEAALSTPREHCYVIPTAGTSPLPVNSASWLGSDDEAMFALANPAGNITLVKLGNLNGIVTVHPLKSASYLGRLWGNIGGMLSSSRGGGPAEGADAAMSLVIHPVHNDVYVFALCKDHKIRMWLTSSHECVMVADVLAHTSTKSAGGSGGSVHTQQSSMLQQGAQNHLLRKITGDSSCKGGFALAVFLCFAQHSQFCVFRPVRTDGQFGLKHLATVYAPEFDLIDFTVTPQGRLVGLWTNPDGVPVLRYANFGASQSEEGCSSAAKTAWSEVTLEEPLDPEFNPQTGDSQFDPRQAYLQQLFYPGRFSIQTLAKTVSIYRRSADMSYIAPDERMTMAKLREEICAAVEVEIQNQVTEYEISDEEHIAISHAAWSRFYSCAIQYHESGLTPMGLVSEGLTGLLAVIKKNGYSFIRPVDALEHLVLTEAVDAVGPELFHDTPVVCEDPALAQDVVSLMRAVALVAAQVPPYMIDEFNHALYYLVSPDQFARKIVTAILTDETDGQETAVLNFTEELGTRLQQIGDVAKALEILLYSLELDRGIVSHSDFDPREPLTNEDTSKLFGSQIGTSIIAESLKQLAQTRFALTRNVIVLQLVMLEGGFSDDVSANAAELIHSTYLPRSVVMAHCYFVLVWLTETTATAPPSDSLEQGLRQMAVLKISDQNTGRQHVAELARSSARPLTLSELFLAGPGGRTRGLLTSDTDHTAPWHTVLMPLVNISAQLLWPRCAVSAFQEFLLTACQHMQIQEYVRLLSTWCDWNCHSRQFLLGSALLNMGEPEKACDWMIEAAGGVGSDRFLTNQLFRTEEVNPYRLTIMYFLKVIYLFEQFGYYDYVIDLAKTAMAVCEDDDPDRTTLCYILFSYHLKLGHNNEAYDAMIANPDQSRRKDSLRQFIVTLFERRQLKQLATFPYIDMFEDVEQIIESRARSVDLNVNNYYDFLYSFHISKENYRKAAHVMYECGMRLGTEVFTHDGLKRQAKCYLACINALKLVDPNYAWIVKPVLKISDARTSEPLGPGVSPKHNLDGDEFMPNALSSKPHMQVLELGEIEKEFQLICVRLKLANKQQKQQGDPLVGMSGSGLSASETVSLLVVSNLYEDAIQIATLFDLDKRPIAEGLTSKCVRLSRSRQGEQDAAWDWLGENNASLDTVNTTSVEAAWKLLESLVAKIEEPRQTVAHKAVVTRLFSLNASLPVWLVAKYKELNAAELLRLYLVHGYLELAGLLASEYLSAVMGTGKEYFGLPNAVHATSPPIWLPHNLFDQLLLELKEHRNDQTYNKLYLEVNDKLDKYLATVARVSEDMLEIRRTC